MPIWTLDKSLKRALRVFVLLSSDRHGMTVKELAKKVGVSWRTAYRYLDALEVAGITVRYRENEEGKVLRFIDEVDGLSVFCRR